MWLHVAGFSNLHEPGVGISSLRLNTIYLNLGHLLTLNPLLLHQEVNGVLALVSVGLSISSVFFRLKHLPFCAPLRYVKWFWQLLTRSSNSFTWNYNFWGGCVPDFETRCGTTIAATREMTRKTRNEEVIFISQTLSSADINPIHSNDYFHHACPTHFICQQKLGKKYKRCSGDLGCKFSSRRCSPANKTNNLRFQSQGRGIHPGMGSEN